MAILARREAEQQTPAWWDMLQQKKEEAPEAYAHEMVANAGFNVDTTQQAQLPSAEVAGLQGRLGEVGFQFSLRGQGTAADIAAYHPNGEVGGQTLPYQSKDEDGNVITQYQMGFAANGEGANGSSRMLSGELSASGQFAAKGPSVVDTWGPQPGLFVLGETGELMVGGAGKIAGTGMQQSAQGTEYARVMNPNGVVSAAAFEGGEQYVSDTRAASTHLEFELGGQFAAAARGPHVRLRIPTWRSQDAEIDALVLKGIELDAYAGHLRGTLGNNTLAAARLALQMSRNSASVNGPGKAQIEGEYGAMASGLDAKVSNFSAAGNLSAGYGVEVQAPRLGLRAGNLYEITTDDKGEKVWKSGNGGFSLLGVNGGRYVSSLQLGANGAFSMSSARAKVLDSETAAALGVPAGGSVAIKSPVSQIMARS